MKMTSFKMWMENVLLDKVPHCDIYHLTTSGVILPGRTFGSWYCQKKQPVITSDKMRKKTKPRCVHFTFILLLLGSFVNATAGAGVEGVVTATDGLRNSQETKTGNKTG